MSECVFTVRQGTAELRASLGSKRMVCASLAWKGISFRGSHIPLAERIPAPETLKQFKGFETPAPSGVFDFESLAKKGFATWLQANPSVWD